MQSVQPPDYSQPANFGAPRIDKLHRTTKPTSENSPEAGLGASRPPITLVRPGAASRVNSEPHQGSAGKIMRKLGLSSRSWLAPWVAEQQGSPSSDSVCRAIPAPTYLTKANYVLL